LVDWAEDQPRRKAATYTGQHKNRIKADHHASREIRAHDPLFERTETVHILDRAAAVTRITFKVLHFEFTILNSIVFAPLQSSEVDDVFNSVQKELFFFSFLIAKM
jgi:hypothetical protein